MEQLRAGAALDRETVKRWPAILFCGAAMGILQAAAWGHSGEFILAKCSTGTDGRVTLVLTVDCGQHPVLHDRSAAQAAMRQALRVETSRGPVALDSLAQAEPGFSTTPDPDLPLSGDPGGAEFPHVLALMGYSWEPEERDVSFSVPAGFPHDVLFWLGGGARPSAGPVPWRILMAGDLTPGIPVPVPQVPPDAGAVARGALAGALGAAVTALVWWQRQRSSKKVN